MRVRGYLHTVALWGLVENPSGEALCVFFLPACRSARLCSHMIRRREACPCCFLVRSCFACVGHSEYHTQRRVSSHVCALASQRTNHDHTRGSPGAPVPPLELKTPRNQLVRPGVPDLDSTAPL